MSTLTRSRVMYWFVLTCLKGPFDLCFIDADKETHGDYYDLYIDLARRGGLIVLDNVLRGGRVLSPRDQGCARLPRSTIGFRKTRGWRTFCSRSATASWWLTGADGQRE
ncbi:MAG: O-methyltransferase [Candidatus Binatia bacterium]